MDHSETLRRVTGARVTRAELMRSKAGVHVWRCDLDGAPCVVKIFDNEDDRREISNYHLLMRLGIPTLPVRASGGDWIALEDLDVSETWRLGTEEDIRDEGVARGLARWYSPLHENDCGRETLAALYSENDAITPEALAFLAERLPEAAETFAYLAARYGALRAAIEACDETLTYNDFHWTNFAVRRDGGAALMFDYNLLGRGHRSGDVRNVQSGLSEAASSAFKAKYDALYLARRGRSRLAEEEAESRVDAVAGAVYALIVAYKQAPFPGWAQETRRMAVDGTLLADARALLP